MSKIRRQHVFYIIVCCLLSIILTGCDSFYTIKDGVKTECDGTIDTCGNDYYVLQDDGTTHHCDAATGCDTAEATPPQECAPEIMFDQLVNEGQSWIVVDHLINQNATATPLQVTFTSTISKSITVSDSERVTASVSAVIAIITLNVKTEINNSVTKTVDATVGSSSSFNIDAGSIGYANYGVRVQIASGHLYDKAQCESKSDWGTDTVYVPIGTGWCFWTSDQPACPTITSN